MFFVVIIMWCGLTTAINKLSHNTTMRYLQEVYEVGGKKLR